MALLFHPGTFVAVVGAAALTGTVRRCAESVCNAPGAATKVSAIWLGMVALATCLLHRAAIALVARTSGSQVKWLLCDTAWFFYARTRWNSLAIPLSAASDDESTVVRVRSGTRRSMASADCTAIHVRRGDKKREDVDQPPLEQFLSEAKKFGRRHLVLASDDELMLNEAAASFDDADFQLHVLTHDHYAKRQVEGYNQQLLNEEMYNRTSVAVDSLRDAMVSERVPLCQRWFLCDILRSFWVDVRRLSEQCRRISAAWCTSCKWCSWDRQKQQSLKA